MRFVDRCSLGQVEIIARHQQKGVFKEEAILQIHVETSGYYRGDVWGPDRASFRWRQIQSSLILLEIWRGGAEKGFLYAIVVGGGLKR